jgi:hypothetical protein
MICATLACEHASAYIPCICHTMFPHIQTTVHIPPPQQPYHHPTSSEAPFTSSRHHLLHNRRTLPITSSSHQMPFTLRSSNLDLHIRRFQKARRAMRQFLQGSPGLRSKTITHRNLYLHVLQIQGVFLPIRPTITLITPKWYIYLPTSGRCLTYRGRARARSLDGSSRMRDFGLGLLKMTSIRSWWHTALPNRSCHPFPSFTCLTLRNPQPNESPRARW